MTQPFFRESHPVTCQILAGALPLIGLLLFRASLFVVDRIFLGHYSVDALASMQISSSILFVLLGLFGSFISGASQYISKSSFFSCAWMRALLFLSLILGTVGAVGALCAKEWLISLFARSGPVVAYEANQYLAWTLPFLPLYLLVMTAQLTLQAQGLTSRSVVISAVGVVIHCILDFFFIFGYLNIGSDSVPQGAAGAALASVLATTCQFFLLFLTLGRVPKFRLNLWDFGLELQAMQKIVKMSLPFVLESLLQFAAFFGCVLLVGMLGKTAMAAQSALLCIAIVCFVLIDGFGRIAELRVGLEQKGNIQKIERMTKTTIALSSSLVALFLSSMLLVPHHFLEFFTTNAEVVAVGISSLPVLAFSQLLACVAVILNDVLRATAASKNGTKIVALGGIIVRLLAGYYFAFELNLGLSGIWWGIALDWLFRCLYALILLEQMRRVSLQSRLSKPL